MPRQAYIGAGNWSLFAWRVHIEQLQSDAIGPPEAVLQGIFAATAATGIGAFDDVFFNELLIRCIDLFQVGKKAGADVLRKLTIAIVLCAFDRQPMQRRPSVGRVPLLSGLYRRRC